MISLSKIQELLTTSEKDLSRCTSGNVSHLVPSVRQTMLFIIEQISNKLSIDDLADMSVKSVGLRSKEALFERNRTESKAFARALFCVYAVKLSIMTIEDAEDYVNLSRSTYYNQLKVIQQSESYQYVKGAEWLKNFHKLIGYE